MELIPLCFADYPTVLLHAAEGGACSAQLRFCCGKSCAIQADGSELLYLAGKVRGDRCDI